MDLWKMQRVVLQIVYMGFPSTCMFTVSWSTSAHSSHIRSCKICIFFDLARFAFNVSPRRVRENSRNIFVWLVLARAVPERIQWILTVLLKKRNFDRWIKRWRTVVPTANNYDRRNRFSTWWWIDVTFGRTSTVSYFCITWTVAKFEISFQRQNFPPEKYKYFTRF